MTEKQFETKVKRFLKYEGAWFLKYWGGGQFTKSGVPDILACVNGRFVGIELKAENGTPSDLQIYNLREIDKAGGYAILLYPEDEQSFYRLIKSIETDDYLTTEMYYTEFRRRWNKWRQSSQISSSV